MQFFLYRHPLYDEVYPTFYGKFDTAREALQAREKALDEDWYFEQDFYIVEEPTNG